MSKLLFLFAPGAGAPSSHPWMQRWKARLESIGTVVTFDYDYMREGRKRPDRPPQLIAAHRAALAEVENRKSKTENRVGGPDPRETRRPSLIPEKVPAILQW